VSSANFQPADLLPIPGVRLGVAAAGIRYRDRNDLVVMELPQSSRCTAVFTRNAFCAAPVTLAREHLSRCAPRFLLINSGNANAGIGERGLADARASCAALAQRAGCDPQQVLPFSTGVIGEPLPVERIAASLDAVLGDLREDGWEDAARAIMTTDTVPKCVSTSVELAGRRVSITGMAKGAGMIRPDMATMLAFLATDAVVSDSALQTCLQQAVAGSFNRITVDGDTSTNDACVLAATGVAATPLLHESHPDYAALCDAVSRVALNLAQLIVRDAEGATKFVSVCVEGGRDSAECLQVAYTIAHSPLVKTALYASDPNWGRILAAVGRAGLVGLDVSRVKIFLDDLCIVNDGGIADGYREEDGQRVMNRPEILIRVELGRGLASETVWTSDFSEEYVRINAEYRT
jgi:glutamate N-acetyltransferase/amino-acid N-acetyltransferase